MTVAFRIDKVRLDTTNGSVTHAFPADLTVLSGRTGVGKTTLLELIKFGLGGDALIAPVAIHYVTDVHVSIRIGLSRLQLSRTIDLAGRGRVRVLDLVTGERLRDRSVGDEPPTISDLLMESLGLETGLRAASRSNRSASAGAQITFNDVFRFMYVPQSEINRDIAGSRDGYYAPKRKAVFELLFGLTSPELLQMRSQINTLRNDFTLATRDFQTVMQFLTDSGVGTRIDAELRQVEARQDEATAQAAIAELQKGLNDVTDRETQVLRELLADAERSLAEASQLTESLHRQRTEYEQERHRVSSDIERLARMASAGERLANIEFAVCPRCTQSLAGRDVPVGACRVCLQDDIVAGLPPRDQYETEQLTSQLGEIDQQFAIIEAQTRQAAEAIISRTSLVRSLTTEIDGRTSHRVTPRLQAYADAVARLERARAHQELLETLLRQWDRAEDLGDAADQMESRRSQLVAQVRAAESELYRRRDEIITELDAEFQSTVTDFGIPSIESVSISRDSYLPVLNGQPFDRVSSGGGIITATQVAYWISLLTVAARRRDTLLPAFLLLDSPRLALNTAEDIAAQMYRRFVTQVAVTPGRLQIIIADNELPAEYDREFAELSFSYETPTITTVAHPGPASVETLNQVRVD